LKKLAVCLRDQLRGTSDQIARLGGESFAVLLPGLDEEICADVAERLRAAVQRMELPHLGLGVNGLVTVSAGVASHVVGQGTTCSSLYQAADTALYQAKIFGRNRVCIATLATPAVLGAPVAG
jgi:diguanylate cyclase (GGDEF)-like protein